MQGCISITEAYDAIINLVEMNRFAGIIDTSGLYYLLTSASPSALRPLGSQGLSESRDEDPMIRSMSMATRSSVPNNEFGCKEEEICGSISAKKKRLDEVEDIGVYDIPTAIRATVIAYVRVPDMPALDNKPENKQVPQFDYSCFGVKVIHP